ncbi:hypothetical protein PTSG_12197 [Salpingoeca rosetta]|uniref:Uncharacterized protein n=1 Tax=Salpingoeca rosetta (strain ATCC 50818 / BSB-021) TaxID=946362 RepID=F2U814_SALR5|nr:uncharacterized protein PTSG_12197 [Salpingoeca rosetta]EGD72919.1 hypothetical protein PTSG_12197 [Salpingoeca rosetta]|eukprot:XP_004994741.1 hypothetical protein PTSG_12197 [Salpingoeca rosetta]
MRTDPCAKHHFPLVLNNQWTLVLVLTYHLPVSQLTLKMLDGVQRPRLIGAAIGFAFMFIGSCLLWNLYADLGLPMDSEAAINYYIFVLWLLGALCIFAVIKLEAAAKHNAMIIAAYAIFASFFTGNGNPAGIPTAFSVLNLLRDQLSPQAFSGGLLAISGMVLSLVSASARMNITDSGKIIKLAATAVSLVTGFIGVIIFWAHDDLKDPTNTGTYTYTGAVLVGMFAAVITTLGSHKGVAGFLLAYLGFFSIFALSSGLTISGSVTGSARDAARAGMVLCTVSALTAIVPGFIVYQEETSE